MCDMATREERFWGLSTRAAAAPGECWLWLGAHHERGYGRVRQGKRIRAAHRVALEIETGEPVPNSMLVLHHCENVSCVNPAHLYLGTAFENVRDREASGRSISRVPRTSRAGRSLLERAERALEYAQRRVSYLRDRIAWLEGQGL